VAMWTWNGSRRRPLPTNGHPAMAPAGAESEPDTMGSPSPDRAGATILT